MTINVTINARNPFLEDLLMSKFDEISAKLDETLAAVQSGKAAVLEAVVAESAQVQAAIGDVLTQEQADALAAKLEAIKAAASAEDVKAAVEGIYNPPESAPAE